jgi:hypothetical protein
MIMSDPIRGWIWVAEGFTVDWSVLPGPSPLQAFEGPELQGNASPWNRKGNVLYAFSRPGSVVPVMWELKRRGVDAVAERGENPWLRDLKV